jgi:hypothetical protein
MKSPAVGIWTPRLRAASDQFRNASSRVKVRTREISTRWAQGADKSEEPANTIYILTALTLGIPALLMILLIGMNPGVQDGSFVSILTLLVGSAFVVAALFEIKRLADQPSGADHHH